MSVSASIDIELSAPNLQQVDVLRLLLKQGWVIYDNGCKSFLPINDKDMFNWHRVPTSQITDADLFAILSIKQSFQELIGVSLSWKDTDIGGEFLISDDLTLCISLSNNRRINTYGLTDFDWYLSRIIPAIDIDEVFIEDISFTEVS